MAATEDFADRAYDWRSEDDAGRWEEDFPGAGVVLGLEEPERFRELLAEFKEAPLRAALREFRWATCRDFAWRPREEVEADPDLVELEPLLDPPDGSLCWSARRVVRAATVDEAGLCRLWQAEAWEECRLAYQTQKALRLADGEYLFDSQFYSVPDGSAKISGKTLEDAVAHPERYALVFSDYHW